MQVSVNKIDNHKLYEEIVAASAKLKALQAIQSKKEEGIETIEIEASLLESMKLSPDTLKARVIAYLRKIKRPRNSEEIRKALNLTQGQRDYVWRMVNAACFDGSPIRRTSLGRYQYKEIA